MDAYTERVLEYNVSSLIEQQFPEFYRTNGPIFVAFVKEYYKWLEGSQLVSNTSFVGKGYVTVQAGNTTVVGTNLVNFTEFFSNGDTIALYESDEKNYDLFPINQVVNSSVIVLQTTPSWSSTNSWYTTTYDQKNPNYYTRRFLESKDIDTTTNDFLVYFKEKYLKNIQFSTKTDIQTLLKHSLDLYRSKGTPRAVDLLFRAVFGTPTSVYFPGDDVFKLSSGQWHIPKYLEISLNSASTKLIGKQIVGTSSGATAFAESLVRRTVHGRLIDVLYISALEGEFDVGETINTQDHMLSRNEWPIIIGSMNKIEVSNEGTGSNFGIGDVVDVFSHNGEQGKAIVQNITDVTGLVNFNLTNGGYGYQNTAQVLVSKEIVSVSNLQINVLNDKSGYVYVFDQMIQPLANITYNSITANLVNGANVYNWSNGVVIGRGQVINSQPNTASTGYIFVSELSGTLNAATLYSTGNTVSIAVNTYTNATCTANVIGYYSNTVHSLRDRVGTFSSNEEVRQYDQYGLLIANGIAGTFTITGGNTSQLVIGNTFGVFQYGKNIVGSVSGAIANIQQSTIFVGVIGVSNIFYSTTNNYVYFSNSQTNGTITSVSQGSLANVSFNSTLSYPEVVSLANDMIKDKTATTLSALTYNFTGFPAGNLTNGTLSQMFANQNYTVGKISQLEGINKGSGYNQAPIIRIYDSAIIARQKKDVILNISGSNGIFQIGEIVTQNIPNSRGIVKIANSTQIRVEQLRVNDANNFVTTANQNTTLVGSQSGATANVTMIDVDVPTQYLGFNAVVDTSVLTAPGAVTNLSVLQSGFGYSQSDSVRFVPEGEDINYPDAGFGFANLIMQGTALGYYKKKGGWLSDQSRLYDGVYYQQYSYEIRSSVTLDKYEEMLKQILHVSGTKYFGALVNHTFVQSNCDVKAARITIETNDSMTFSNVVSTQYIPIF